MQNRLDNKQQAIIPIAAFAAKGDTEKLAAEIQHGLDTGLTINEIKEVLIQLYAYAGFPRSLNALGGSLQDGIDALSQIDGLPRLRIGVDLVDLLVRSGYGDFSLARGRLNGLAVELTRWDAPSEHREEHDQHERDGVHMGKLEMESALGLLLFGIRHS